MERVEEIAVYKSIEVETEEGMQTQEVVDYVLKHTYEDEVLISTFKVYDLGDCISQIQVYPVTEIIPEYEQVDEEKAAMAEAIIDMDARLTALENGGVTP